MAIDTSGSIGQRELSAFLTEVKEICETVHPERVRLMYWDTRVCRDEKYDMHELDTLVQSTKPAGGGGTDVDCVTDYIRDNNINAQACNRADRWLPIRWLGSVDYACVVVRDGQRQNRRRWQDSTH